MKYVEPCHSRSWRQCLFAALFVLLAYPVYAVNTNGWALGDGYWTMATNNPTSFSSLNNNTSVGDGGMLCRPGSVYSNVTISANVKAYNPVYGWSPAVSMIVCAPSPAAEGAWGRGIRIDLTADNVATQNLIIYDL